MEGRLVPRSKWLDSGFKRSIDVVGALVGLVVAAPVVIVCSLLVVTTSRGGPFFRQRRAGRNGTEFDVLKLRTMTATRAGDWDPSTDAARLTKVGRVLRKISFDELPQLWNILVGEMSLVGPRPLPVQYVDRYSPSQKRRLEARPGLTGLAQVEGRNSLSWPEKFDLDVAYVVGASLKMDVRIVLATMSAVLARSGVSSAGHATMPEFTGED